VQVVRVLICVALCVDWHMALRLGSASMAMNDVPPRNRGGGRHSGLVCVVRRASVRPAQMPYHSEHIFARATKSSFNS
jgi:hypothetical protein